MTKESLSKRENKAQLLKVFSAEPGAYYVESSEGKICYKVSINGSESCSCGDYTSNSKNDAEFRCKHIIAVINGNGNIIHQTDGLISKPKLDERFITKISGKEFVLYSGLLDLGHQRGLTRLEVEILQYPNKDNGSEAICRATARSNGSIFTDIGDANPKNCNRLIAQHLLRMASTRAKARVLRDLTNIGMTSLEELGEIDEVVVDSSKKSTTRRSSKKETKTTTTDKPIMDKSTTETLEDVKPNNNQSIEVESHEKQTITKQTNKTDKSNSNDKSNGKAAKSSSNSNGSNGSGKISDAQKRALENLSRRRGISMDELETMSEETYQLPLDQISNKDASSLIRHLQTAA